MRQSECKEQRKVNESSCYTSSRPGQNCKGKTSESRLGGTTILKRKSRYMVGEGRR